MYNNMYNNRWGKFLGSARTHSCHTFQFSVVFMATEMIAIRHAKKNGAELRTAEIAFIAFSEPRKSLE
mgnify:CR=1 FL=1